MTDLIELMARALLTAQLQRNYIGKIKSAGAVIAIDKCWHEFEPEVRAALKAAEEAGWALVPKEPTQAMVCAAERAHGLLEGFRAEDGYRTMIAARPSPPGVRHDTA